MAIFNRQPAVGLCRRNVAAFCAEMAANPFRVGLCFGVSEWNCPGFSNLLVWIFKISAKEYPPD